MLIELDRYELTENTRKDSPQAQKVINFLILLNCYQSEFNAEVKAGEASIKLKRLYPTLVS